MEGWSKCPTNSIFVTHNIVYYFDTEHPLQNFSNKILHIFPYRVAKNIDFKKSSDVLKYIQTLFRGVPY